MAKGLFKFPSEHNGDEGVVYSHLVIADTVADAAVLLAKTRIAEYAEKAEVAKAKHLEECQACAANAKAKAEGVEAEEEDTPEIPEGPAKDLVLRALEVQKRIKAARKVYEAAKKAAKEAYKAKAGADEDELAALGKAIGYLKRPFELTKEADEGASDQVVAVNYATSATGESGPSTEGETLQ